MRQNAQNMLALNTACRALVALLCALALVFSGTALAYATGDGDGDGGSGTETTDPSTDPSTDPTEDPSTDPVVDPEPEPEPEPLKAPKVPKIKAAVVTPKGIKVTWKASKKSSTTEVAKYYVIARKVGANGTWKKAYKTVKASKLTFIDKKVKSKKRYFYKVKALDATKKKASAYSKVKKRVFVPATNFAYGTIVSKSSIRLHWNTRSDVKGYRIYIKKSNGTYRRIKTIADPEQFRYLAEKLSYKTKYTFALRTYVQVGSSNYYSTYSTLKKKLKYRTVYEDGLKYYYDMDGGLITDVRGIVGNRSNYRIKVNTRECVTTIYAKDGSNGYIIPIKSWLCSPGADGGTVSGTWYLQERFRWRVLYYSCYSQWGAVIHGDILFHTAPYTAYQNKKKLDVDEYNKLGTACSHGCVRLQCEAAKWIRDNCTYNTQVVIYRSSNPGPFGKPELEELPSWHKWDPTDPTSKSLCEKHGCHHDVTS